MCRGRNDALALQDATASMSHEYLIHNVARLQLYLLKEIVLWFQLVDAFLGCQKCFPFQKELVEIRLFGTHTRALCTGCSCRTCGSMNELLSICMGWIRAMRGCV